MQKFCAVVEVCSFKIEDLADNLVRLCQSMIKNNSSDLIWIWQSFTYQALISTIFHLQTSTKAQNFRKRIVQNAVYLDNQICLPIYLLKRQIPWKSEK